MSDLVDFLLARIAEDEARVVGRSRRAVYFGEVVYDPDRVLTECDAKRRIVEEHSGGEEVTGGYCPAEGGRYERDRCPTLMALAMPYADHPEFREEWRP